MAESAHTPGERRADEAPSGRLAQAMARVDHGDEMADAHLLSEVEAALFGRTPEPWRLGRYLIVESIGRGGFGTVYLGYDPELDRRVAIKVLRGGSGSSGGSRGEQLRSEAQAMAQVNHPNVAAVYDVARVGKSEEGPLAKEGQLFLVMEYLSGGTLGEMLERKPEPSCLVEVFLDAARGLAAAHERGLVHLDFKPANVMFDEAGRVRVLDFGLARGAKLASSATGGDSYAGTPQYMAPEQLAGEPPDARADQYSFCVALYEALAGRVAFDVTGLEDLIHSKTAGPPIPPEGSKVAPRLWRIVQRGMSPKVEDRYPDMQALIADLSVDPRRLKLRRVAVLGTAMVLAVGGLAGAKLYQDFRNQCEAQPEAWAGIWDDEAKAKLRTSFAANPKAPPDSIIDATLARFDDYRQRWDQVETRACAETRFAGRVPETELESRRFCLHRQRRMIGGYAQAPFDDPALTDALLRRAQQLPDPEDCVVRRAEAPLPLAGDPDARRQALELAAANATVAILSVSGEHESARVKARENLDTARANHDAFAETQALSSLLRIAVVRSEYDQCEALALAGFDAADRADAPELWLRIADMWLSCLSRSDQVAAAETVYAYALQRAQTRAAGGVTLAGFQRSWGQALIDAGRVAEGRERLEDALEAARAELGDEHVSLGGYYNSLGNAYIANPPDLDLATGYYERARELWARDYGPMHENVGHATNNLAIIQIHRGQFQAAREGLQLALKIYARTFGEESASMAFPLANLGEVDLYLANYDSSLEYSNRAIAIHDEIKGPDSLALVNPLLNKADALAELGRSDEAIAQMERVLELLHKHEREDDIPLVQAALARLLVATGHPERARTLRATISWSDAKLSLPRAQTDALFALDEGDATALLEASRRVDKLAEPGSYQLLEGRIFALEAAALGAETSVDPAALVRDIEALLGKGHPLTGRVWIAEAVTLREHSSEESEQLAERALERLGPAVSVQHARWFGEFGLFAR